MMELLDDHWKEITVNNYVCSNCWGHLLAYPKEDRMWLVVCHRCGEETKGYVTKYFADTRRDENGGEFVEARVMLQKLGIISNPHEGKGEEQLKKELGF